MSAEIEKKLFRQKVVRRLKSELKGHKVLIDDPKASSYIEFSVSEASHHAGVKAMVKFLRKNEPKIYASLNDKELVLHMHELIACYQVAMEDHYKPLDPHYADEEA